MTDESKIVWANELWVPPSSMRWVNGGHIVATTLSLRFVEGEFTHPLYNTPPQRTWVGLTWNDVPNEWVGKVAFMEGAKWADKQLKEKNT